MGEWNRSYIPDQEEDVPDRAGRRESADAATLAGKNGLNLRSARLKVKQDDDRIARAMGPVGQGPPAAARLFLDVVGDSCETRSMLC